MRTSLGYILLLFAFMGVTVIAVLSQPGAPTPALPTFSPIMIILFIALGVIALLILRSR